MHLLCILTSRKSGCAYQWMVCPHLVGNIFYSLVTRKTLVHLKKMVSQTQSRTAGGTATRDRLACTQSPSGPELIRKSSRPPSLVWSFPGVLPHATPSPETLTRRRNHMGTRYPEVVGRATSACLRQQSASPARQVSSLSCESTIKWTHLVKRAKHFPHLLSL